MSFVLAINAGSSSIKLGLFMSSAKHDIALHSRGVLENGGATRSVSMFHPTGRLLAEVRLPSGAGDGGDVLAILEWIDAEIGADGPIAVGHRVVHGGREFSGPVVVDPDTFARIERLTPLAPLHQPRCLAPIRAIFEALPSLVQVACFDTAFHNGLVAPVSRYALPRRFEAEGVRKYGFHGLSYEFIAGRLKQMSGELSAGRTVVAHLGNGASLCAMRDGRSVDTTMGFSTLDGLMMGSRCGALDPGVVLYLQRAHGMSLDEIEEVLYRRSGLLGVSEIASDIQTLLASDDPRAREAIDLFAFQAARATTVMANTLEGLDCLVFTGGIGEHSAEIRANICNRLRWLGVELDPAPNQRHERCISGPGSRVTVLMVPTDEAFVIARETLERVEFT